MTPRMQAILDRIYQYNARHLAQHTFGLSEETVYDALVVAPSYAPRKIITDSRYEIRETGGQSYCTDLIEMETATFYALAEIMGIPAVALLVVSDNSATGAPLVGRSEELQQRYEHTRRVVLMELIGKIAGL